MAFAASRLYDCVKLRYTSLHLTFGLESLRNLRICGRGFFSCRTSLWSEDNQSLKGTVTFFRFEKDLGKEK